MTQEQMQIVVLAGGLGTRLYPLTHDIPKPMIPIGDKPYLHYQVEYLRQQGFQRYLFLTGHLSEQIEDYFGDGSNFDVEISYSVEPEPLGTGGGLRLALPLLADHFILVYGDSFLPIDFNMLVEKTESDDFDATMVIYDNNELTDVPDNVLLDSDGRVSDYDKENPDEMNYVEAGVLAFRKSVIEEIPGDRKFSLEMDKFPQLIAQNRMSGFVTRERFYDIGTPARLEEFKQVINDYFPNPL
jgi:NDP-sugar pyrophosphorylase family protein